MPPIRYVRVPNLMGEYPPLPSPLSGKTCGTMIKLMAATTKVQPKTLMDVGAKLHVEKEAQAVKKQPKLHR